MLTTTLENIRKHQPCSKGWARLLAYLGKTGADNDPLPYKTILESNGLEDALWCCRAEPQYSKEWRLFAIWCSRQVEHLMTDTRSRFALDVAERHANGEATDEELADAAAAAWVATRDAAGKTTLIAAGEAALTAAGEAAGEAAWAAAWAAARATSMAAAWATLRATARDAARATARDAARAAQKEEFLRVVGKAG